MDASAGNKATAVHVLVFPFPAQGHVTSMLKLAELLSLAGLRVTFVNTDHNDALLRRFSAAYARLSLNHRFHFRTIPEGLDDDDSDSRSASASNFIKLEESLRGPRAMASFKEILAEHGSQSVTCAVIDGMLVCQIEFAEGLGIPTIAFRTSSSCSFWAYFCIPNLIQSGEIPIPGDKTSRSRPSIGKGGRRITRFSLNADLRRRRRKKKRFSAIKIQIKGILEDLLQKATKTTKLCFERKWKKKIYEARIPGVLKKEDEGFEGLSFSDKNQPRLWANDMLLHARISGMTNTR